MRVEINASKPLRHGVLIQGKKGIFWQQFVYENLSAVCYRCGRIRHLDDGCGFSKGDRSSDNSDCPILPENLMAVGGEAAPDGPTPLVAKGRSGDRGGRPRLCPWLVTSHIRQPRAPSAPVKERRDLEKDKKLCPESLDPYSFSPPLSSPRNNSSPSNSPSDLDSW